MAGFTQTYGQVRDYVQGSGCTKGDDRIAIMMISCLQELWTIVCDDPYFRKDFEILTVEGESKVDISECATISKIQVKYNDDDGNERCRTLQSPVILPEMSNCGCSAQDIADDLCEHDNLGCPTDFEIVGDDLCLTPTPDGEYKICIDGFREVDCELSTIDDDGNIVWNNVDLPPRYQAQLANLVLSKYYAEEGDFASSAYWEQKVSTGLDSLIEKRQNRYNEDADRPNNNRGTQDFVLICRGSRKACGRCGEECCCCEPNITQTIIERVRVDCDGNEIIQPSEDELQPTGKGGRLE